MMKLIIYLLLTIVLQNQAFSLDIKPREVHSYGGTSFTYWGYHIVDSKPYAIIEAYAEDVWHYSIGDTMWLDSAALVVKSIDTLSNSATVDIVPNIFGKKRDSTLIGAWGDGVLVQNKCIIKILNVTDSCVSLRLYSTNSKKMFVYENDTVVILNDNLSNIHVYEEGLPIVNCRSIVVNDTLLPLKMSSFYLTKRCSNNPLWVKGHIKGVELKLQIEFEDEETVEYLYLNGNVDSTDITINLNEKSVCLFDSTVISVKWIFNIGAYGYDQAIGFCITEKQSTAINLLHTPFSNKCGINVNSNTFNLLGQSLLSKESKSSIFISKNKKELFFKGNRVP